MTTTAPFTEELAPGVHRVFSHAAVRDLEQMLDRVGELDGAPGAVGRCTDIGRVELLGALERLKASIAAAEARITREFEQSQLAQQDEAARVEREAGHTARAERLEAERGRGIGDQVALARNESTSTGARHLSFARAMQEMPHTLGLLSRGQISEWVATLLVRETEVLSTADRAEVDRRMCAMTANTKTGELQEPAVLGMTPHRVENRARNLAAELDADAVVRRSAKSRARRRVTIRPTPTTMTYLTGLLPVKDGVAVYASLQAGAKAAKAAGDERTEAQLMADLLVQRVTGSGTGIVPVQVQLVMSAATFTGDSDQPAHTQDGAVVPAGMAREWVHDDATPVTIRRLFTDPVTGQATQSDTRRRHHSSADKAFIRLRDQHCRMPGCDRPIADIDHPVRHADGGPSTRANGQGLCKGHNLAKEAPGWRTRVSDPRPGHHEVEVITPTGHVYRSKAPPAMPPPVRPHR